MAHVVSKDRVLISELLDAIKTYLDEDAQKFVYDAYLLAAEAHEGQTRRSGDPYIYHPIAVALILANMKMDSTVLAAAILHDVIEDTPVTKKQIVERFGDKVAEMVDGVSKISQISNENREHAEAKSFRKMLMAMAKDVRVMLIKLADRYHNMATIDSLPVEKQRRIAKQTMDIYAPIATRLGMYSFSSDLEDLCFKNLISWSLQSDCPAFGPEYAWTKIGRSVDRQGTEKVFQEGENQVFEYQGPQEERL